MVSSKDDEGKEMILTYLGAGQFFWRSGIILMKVQNDQLWVKTKQHVKLLKFPIRNIAS